jgi:hypothetical protein
MNNIDRIIGDIKGIVAVLDPEGYKRAEEMKRERNSNIHPLFRGIVNNIGGTSCSDSRS